MTILVLYIEQFLSTMNVLNILILILKNLKCNVNLIFKTIHVTNYVCHVSFIVLPFYSHNGNSLKALPN